MKRWLIGIDEAGYGPKIGPLVIGASVWLVPEELETERMLALLSPEFQSSPWQSESLFVPMGDSKAIYSDKRHLDSLSLAIHFLLGLQGYVCDSVSNLIHRLGAQDATRVESRPWYAPSPDRTALDFSPIAAALQDAGRRKLEKLGIEFRGFQIRILDEEEFNRVVATSGNKASALGEWSLGLLRDCISAHTGQTDGVAFASIDACCDRQGGRKRYLPLLDHAFQEHVPWFDIVEETDQSSRYRGRFGSHDLRVRFQVGGDALLPTAVASMLAKWVRELLMLRLNDYWREHVGADLRPTAGYPVDAERFRAAISERATSLLLPNHTWWRCC